MPGCTSDKNYALSSKSIPIHHLISLPLIMFYINVGRLHHHYINHEWGLIVQEKLFHMSFLHLLGITFENGLQLYALHVEVITLL